MSQLQSLIPKLKKIVIKKAWTSTQIAGASDAQIKSALGLNDAQDAQYQEWYGRARKKITTWLKGIEDKTLIDSIKSVLSSAQKQGLKNIDSQRLMDIIGGWS